MEKKKWIAYYQPHLDHNAEDPSAFFDTKKEAEDYVISKNCNVCKESDDECISGLGSACAVEWLIIHADKFDGVMKEPNKHIKQAKLMEAAGFKRVDKSSEY